MINQAIIVLDNFDKLQNILQFTDNSYYKFSVLLRNKDNAEIKNAKQDAIKSWLCSSFEQINIFKNEMINICRAFNGRLYVNLDRGSTIKTLLEIKKYIDTQIEQYIFSEDKIINPKIIYRAFESNTDIDKSKDNKKWLIDIDKKDLLLFTKVKEVLPEQYFEEIFETKNGYHLIYKRKFNISEYLKSDITFDEESKKYIIEYKSNAKTLVYMEYLSN